MEVEQSEYTVNTHSHIIDEIVIPLYFILLSLLTKQIPSEVNFHFGSIVLSNQQEDEKNSSKQASDIGKHIIDLLERSSYD
jgi:hypothetical protein